MRVYGENLEKRGSGGKWRRIPIAAETTGRRMVVAQSFGDDSEEK